MIDYGNVLIVFINIRDIVGKGTMEEIDKIIEGLNILKRILSN
jgi:hypothetical protein